MHKQLIVNIFTPPMRRFVAEKAVGEAAFADDMVESIGNALAKIIKNLPPIVVL